MNTEFIDEALRRYPLANKSHVERYVNEYLDLYPEAYLQLKEDVKYQDGFNNDTVEAIMWVLKHKHAFTTMAD